MIHLVQNNLGCVMRHLPRYTFLLLIYCFGGFFCHVTVIFEPLAVVGQSEITLIGCSAEQIITEKERYFLLNLSL